jgi:oligopeptide/dipeptide ABC transporter ATP-binding protein
MTETDELLAVHDLVVEFHLGRHRPPLRAVDEVSLDLRRGETLGLVGESGSGKTTLGRAILGLVPIQSGTVTFDGRDITHAGYRQRRRLSSELQVVFQDPFSSLNPTRTIGQTLEETLRVHDVSRKETTRRVTNVLERVGLPGDARNRYPANFSGGQRQRIAIARALLMEPRLIVCDEPVSALDLSVQAQVLNLLHELQTELGLSYLFVAHDLDVVRHLSHRIAVLYRGQIMEEGSAESVHGEPVHPYTRALIGSAPVPDPIVQRQRRLSRPRSLVSDARGTPTACPFAPRCQYMIERCLLERPKLEVTPDGRLISCHRWRELVAVGES